MESRSLLTKPRALVLGICLVTVPSLCRAVLESLVSAPWGNGHTDTEEGLSAHL